MHQNAYAVHDQLPPNQSRTDLFCHAFQNNKNSSSTVGNREIGTSISEASKRVPIFPFDTQGGKQASSYFVQRNWVQAREAQIRFPASWLEFDGTEWSSCARQRASSTIFRYLWLTIPTRQDSIQYRVGKTHCQGHQDPSKRVPIFLGTHEANVKMVPIYAVPISRLRTVIITSKE